MAALTWVLPSTTNRFFTSWDCWNWLTTDFLGSAPILAVPGIRELLRRAQAPVIAVSPLIGGAAVKGPAAKIMNELELPVSPLEIARQYGDFLDVMLIDEGDRALIAAREADDPELETAAILMKSSVERRRLAEACLALLRRGRGAGSTQSNGSSS